MPTFIQAVQTLSPRVPTITSRNRSVDRTLTRDQLVRSMRGDASKAFRVGIVRGIKLEAPGRSN